MGFLSGAIYARTKTFIMLISQMRDKILPRKPGFRSAVPFVGARCFSGTRAARGGTAAPLHPIPSAPPSERWSHTGCQFTKQTMGSASSFGRFLLYLSGWAEAAQGMGALPLPGNSRGHSGRGGGLLKGLGAGWWDQIQHK